MKLSELMKNHTPSTSFEGFVTNDDFVLAVDCSADGTLRARQTTPWCRSVYPAWMHSSTR